MLAGHLSLHRHRQRGGKEGQVLHRSKRGWVWNQFFVIEEYTGPDPVLVGRVSITNGNSSKSSAQNLTVLISLFQLHSDVDTGIGNIKYILSGEGAGTIFVIDDKTGNIHATKTLDREEQAQYTLTAQAVDRHTNKPLEPPSEFIVKVQDINDNPPEFLHGPYYARVPEMSNVCEYKNKAYFNPTKNKISKTPNKTATGDYFLFPDDVWHFLLRHVICTQAWDVCYVENMPAYGSYIATAAPRDALTTISGAGEEWATANTEYLSLTKSGKRSTSVLEIMFTRINTNINA